MAVSSPEFLRRQHDILSALARADTFLSGVSLAFKTMSLPRVDKAEPVRPTIPLCSLRVLSLDLLSFEVADGKER